MFCSLEAVSPLLWAACQKIWAWVLCWLWGKAGRVSERRTGHRVWAALSLPLPSPPSVNDPRESSISQWQLLWPHYSAVLVFIGQPGLCLWDQRCAVLGPDHHEWGWSEVSHLQHGEPWLWRRASLVLCSWDPLWPGRLTPWEHCLQVSGAPRVWPRDAQWILESVPDTGRYGKSHCLRVSHCHMTCPTQPWACSNFYLPQS